MNITRLTVTRAELPLARALRSSRGTLSVRPVLLAALWDDRRHVAIGEAAPMPEHGTESFDLACDALSRVALRREFPALPPDIHAFAEWLRALGLARDFAPASCWALECALATLSAAEQGASLAEWLGAETDRVPVNALIGGGDAEHVLLAASRAVTEGYRTLKLKVGVAALRAEIETVRRLREAFPATTLRLDANGALSFDEARQLAHAVTSSGVEYLEDPLAGATPDNLRLFREAVRVPLALDESLHDDERFARIVGERLCDVVVIKPAVVGSFARLWEMTQVARQQRIGVVISNLIESAVGLGYAAHVAAARGGVHHAHGLGTGALFARDTLADGCAVTRGELPLSDPRQFAGRLSLDLAQALGLTTP